MKITIKYAIIRTWKWIIKKVGNATKECGIRKIKVGFISISCTQKFELI